MALKDLADKLLQPFEDYKERKADRAYISSVNDINEEGWHTVGNDQFYAINQPTESNETNMVYFKYSRRNGELKQWDLEGSGEVEGYNHGQDIGEFLSTADLSMDDAISHFNLIDDKDRDVFYNSPESYDVMDAIKYERDRLNMLKKMETIDVDSLNPTEKELYNKVILGNKQMHSGDLHSAYKIATNTDMDYHRDAVAGYSPSSWMKKSTTELKKAWNYFNHDFYVGDKYPEHLLKMDFDKKLTVTKEDAKTNYFGEDEIAPFLFNPESQKYTDAGLQIYKESDRYLVDKNFNVNYVPDTGLKSRNKGKLDKSDFKNMDEIFAEHPEYASIYTNDILNYKQKRLTNDFYPKEDDNPYGEVAKFTGFLEDNPELYADILKASDASGIPPNVIFTSMMQEGLIKNFRDNDYGFDNDDVIYSSSDVVDTFGDWGLDAVLSEQDRMGLKGDYIYPSNEILGDAFKAGNLSFDRLPYNISKDILQNKFDDNALWDLDKIDVGSAEGKEWLMTKGGLNQSQYDELLELGMLRGERYGDYSVGDLVSSQYEFITNEADDAYPIGDITLKEGITLGAGMLKLNEEAFLRDAKKSGYDVSKISEEDKAFWTYVYYNGGSGVGRGSLNKWGLKGYENKDWDTDLAFNARRTAGNIKAMNESGFFVDEDKNAILEEYKQYRDLDINDLNVLIANEQIGADTLDRSVDQIKEKFNISDDQFQSDSLKTIKTPTMDQTEIPSIIEEEDDTSWLYEEGDIINA